MKNVDSRTHVRGESVYLDDIPLVQGTLFACVYDSPHAHGILKSLDISAAESSEGVFRVITASDIPGDNEIGGILPDEPLLADKEVHFQGMPVAIVLATTEEFARLAAAKITCEIEPLEIVTDPRVAFEKYLRSALSLLLEFDGLQTVLLSPADESAEIAASKAEIFGTFEGVLDRAKGVGAVRNDLTLDQISHLACGIEYAVRLGAPGDRESFLDILIAGLRPA